MRAATVCVEYEDLLAVSLPWNLPHFKEVLVVTSPACADRVRGVTAPYPNTKVHVTDVFYQRGAAFNKWAALEEGLDAWGRHGWVCLWDCDTLWPRDVVVVENEQGRSLWLTRPESPTVRLWPGWLCTPVRHMLLDVPVPLTLESVPAEDTWSKLPVHPNLAEWAGYSQIFHADDPVLGPPPWHDVNWKTAGCADSFFQRKWPGPLKIRPTWGVLHLGPAGANWMGRTTPFVDGSGCPAAAEERARAMGHMFSERRRTGSLDAERLTKDG